MAKDKPNEMAGDSEVVENENNEQIEEKSDLENFSEKMDEIVDTESEDEDQHLETEVSDTSSEEEDDDDVSAEIELSEEEQDLVDELDEDVIQCCHDYGWDMKKIAQVAKITPELFDDIRDELDELDLEDFEDDEEVDRVDKSQRKSQKEKEDDIDDIKFDIDPNMTDPKVIEILKKQNQSINSLRNDLTLREQQLEQEKAAAFNARIDRVFDSFSKEIPALGKGSKLDRKQARVRETIFTYASAIAQRRRIPLEVALEREIQRFKNTGSKKEAGRELLSKVNKSNKRVINKPTRKQTNLSTRKFSSPEEEKIAIMTEAYKEAGIED